MPRNNNAAYALPPGSLAQPNTKVRSQPYNAAMQDIANDLNTPRPPSAGGTGETTPEGAREALGAVSINDVNDLMRGMILPFLSPTAPAGWLICNGQEVSRSTYAALHALIGPYVGPGNGVSTFNLPDFRGQFIRGLDLGRGVDPDRTLGSTQADDVKSHDHEGEAEQAGAHTHSYNITNLVGGATLQGYISGSGWGVVGVAETTASAGGHVHPLDIEASGGSESRPKNIALVWCIKF